MEGGSLPKKTVDWEVAVALVGDAALRAAGTSARGHTSAYGNWKNERGVPWYIVGPLLLKRPEIRAALDPSGHKEQNSQGKLLPSSKLPALREAPVPPPLEEARSLLSRIFFRYKPNSKQWRAVVDVLELAAPPEDAREAEPRIRKKATGARQDAPAK